MVLHYIMKFKGIDFDHLKVDEVLRRNVARYGNSAHLNIPTKHLKKKAIILILKKR